MKTFKWTIQIEVAETWVADGFDMTDERATEMLEKELEYAYEGEFSAKVIKSPNPETIKKAQGIAI